MTQFPLPRVIRGVTPGLGNSIFSPRIVEYRPSRIWRTLTRKSTWLNLPRTVSMALKVIFPKATKDTAVLSTEE